jgi:hypothetical protein
MRQIILFIGSVVSSLSIQAQAKKEASTYFAMVEHVVSTATDLQSLVYRLDTLKTKFMPSDSYLDTSLSRELDFGYLHQRVSISFDFSEFQLDLLLNRSQISLWSLSSSEYDFRSSQLKERLVKQFIAKWNKFYASNKSKNDLVNEISSSDVFAFYCGNGGAKTEEGKKVEAVVGDRNIHALADMLRSFSCERQSYGVAGIAMIEKAGMEIDAETQHLVDHIKRRNAKIVICSGCFRGLIRRIYSR